MARPHNPPSVRQESGHRKDRPALPGKDRRIDRAAACCEENAGSGLQRNRFPGAVKSLVQYRAGNAVQPPFDKITHEISDKEFRIVAGEKQVGKKVQKPISYPSPFRTAKEKKSMT